jgi:hypothetical protein
MSSIIKVKHLNAWMKILLRFHTSEMCRTIYFFNFEDFHLNFMCHHHRHQCASPFALFMTVILKIMIREQIGALSGETTVKNQRET